MPREVVQPAGRGPFAVKVGWSHENNLVQVGVETDDGRSLFWELLESKVSELGEAAMRAVTAEQRIREANKVGENGPPADSVYVGREILNAMDVATLSYRGVWSDLDRDGCNRLVRILRKARDAAFGRDE